MARHESVLEAFGGTPLVRLTRSTAHLRPAVYVKPEWSNPGGSVKDRTALAMVRHAETEGLLRPGGTIVEVTSGNTGIALALVAAQLGYRAVIFCSPNIAWEKRAQITAYGAELRLVDSFVPKDDPASLRSHAERFAAETPGAWFAAQYDNPANPAIHHDTTGPEIWRDSEGRVTHLVSTIGTGGTISGAGRFLKEASDGRVRVLGADPATSAYVGGDGSQKYIEGAGHFVHPLAEADTWPTALDLDVVDDILGVPDEVAIATVLTVARDDGLLVGGSSGVALAAAFTAARDLSEDDLVVVLLPDSGRAYLSTYFSPEWRTSTGFEQSASAVPTVGDRSRPAVFVEVDEPVSRVVARLERSAPLSAPLVVVHRRARTRLAPHPTDVVGTTTLRRLSSATTVADAVVPAGPRLGLGLAVTAPDVIGWRREDGDVALVLDRGRVSGTVTWAQLHPQETFSPAGVTA